MIAYIKYLFIITFYLLISVKTQTNIPIGWFIDDTASNDVDAEVFSKALSAAIHLTDQYIWPKNQYTFQPVYENDTNVYSGFHQICNRLESGAIGSISSIDNQKTNLFESFMTRLRISMISLNYFNYNKQELNTINRIYHLAMKIDLLLALAAFIKHYKITKLFYIIEGEEFARFQAMMAAQAREKSYDILDIQVRRLTDIQNQNHTRNLLESVEIKDRGSKEERYIVLDLDYVNSYINLLMQNNSKLDQTWMGRMAGAGIAIASGFANDIIRVATPSTAVGRAAARVAFSVATSGLGIVHSVGVAAWSAVDTGKHIFSYINRTCDDIITITDLLIMSIIECNAKLFGNNDLTI